VHPECAGGPYGLPAPDSCREAFCGDPCYSELANLHDDCINNPRTPLPMEQQQTILQLAPQSLLALCGEPDSGTVLPHQDGH